MTSELMIDDTFTKEPIRNSVQKPETMPERGDEVDENSRSFKIPTISTT